MKSKIISQIPAECPWRDTLYWYDTIDSTNTKARALAKDGAPHGTVLIADRQTAGRGRLGRSFVSPEGAGVYLSVILRPRCSPAQLMHLTCAVGVAICDAVEKAAGIRPGVKWINDIVWQKKKLGGILTELSVDPKTGMIDYAVVGVGINCLQAEFPKELESIVSSLATAGKPVSTDTMAAGVIESLWQMDRLLLTEKEHLMERYRSLCITLGQDIRILQPEVTLTGKALKIDSDGALIAQLSDGSQITVNSGEVSIRGMYDYI